MASVWGDNTLDPSQSAGFYFDRVDEPKLVLISVKPITASEDFNGQWTNPNGWPLVNQLGVSSGWVNKKEALGPNMRYYIVVTNSSNSIIRFSFVEADL